MEENEESAIPKKPVSTIHKKRCPACGKIAVETYHEREDDGFMTIALECGHVITEEMVEESEDEVIESEFISETKDKPFPFQTKGIKFLESCDGRGLIADEPGLGKTIQGLGFLFMHPEAMPAIVATKASLKVQWERCAENWLRIYGIQIINGSRTPPLKHARLVIVGVDSLSNAKWLDDESKFAHIKTVIIDECQTIKNMDAKRTKAVRKLTKDKKHIIALSGTPIKNNAPEYFPILNILRPRQFYGFNAFIQDWVDTYTNGYTVKYGGIRPDKLDDWKYATSEFILRRTRDEVKDEIIARYGGNGMPPIMRQFQYHDLGDSVRQAYTAAYDDFMEAQDSSYGAQERFANSLAAMSRMRHLTGLAKVEPCIEYVEDFINQYPDRKICIFAHHRDVIGMLDRGLSRISIENGNEAALVITGETPGDSRQEIIDEFKNNPRRRIMILSTLAAGEGLNLQFCQDAIILERQWNPANEEQAEGRFSRIGSMADFINALYFVAIDTIDEFFAKLVEEKRSFMASTLDGTSYEWSETSLMQELTQKLIDEGRKPWMLNPNKRKN